MSTAERRKEESKDGMEIVHGDGQTLLLVEDDAAIMRMGRMMPERINYKVLTAKDPEQALKVAAGYKGETHLLITDVIMPLMNGRELAVKLKALKPSIRTLYMSGYTADVIAPHGVLVQGVHFLQKSFSFREIATAVGKALDN